MSISSVFSALFAFVVLTLAPALLPAQNLYSFEEKSGTYATLEGATKIDTARYGVGDLYHIDLSGETFWFYNIPFRFGGLKSFTMQQGNIRIDNDSALIIVDGIFCYLDSIDATSDMSYRIEGKSGEKIVKTQWRNAKIREGEAVNFVNLQIWVYQATGVIEIHYGPSSPNNQAGFNTTTGPQVGMFFARDDFSKVFGKLWVNGSPTKHTLDSAKNLSFKAMSGVPVNGTIYRFIPRFALSGVKEEKKSKSELHLYPQPAGERIYLQTGDNEDIRHCRILNLHGEQVGESYEANEVSLVGLAQGIYIVEANTGNKRLSAPLLKYE